MTVRSPLRQQVLTLSRSRSGVTTNGIPGYTIKQVGRAIEDMLSRGLLFAAKDGSKFRRYFSSAERAESFSESIASEGDARAEHALKRSPEFVADWKPGQKVIYPKGVKVTVYPPSRMGEFVTNTHKDW